MGSIPWGGRSPGGEHDNPLQYCCSWRHSWTEEPGRLQSIGSHRVRHDWVTWHAYTQPSQRNKHKSPSRYQRSPKLAELSHATRCVKHDLLNSGSRVLLPLPPSSPVLRVVWEGVLRFRVRLLCLWSWSLADCYRLSSRRRWKKKAILIPGRAVHVSAMIRTEQDPWTLAHCKQRYAQHSFSPSQVPRSWGRCFDAPSCAAEKAF